MSYCTISDKYGGCDIFSAWKIELVCMMYDDWVMIVSDGLFVHLNKAKKAISPSQKPSITDGLSSFSSLLEIEEWRAEKEFLEKKTEKGRKEGERSRLFLTPQLGNLGAIFHALLFLIQWNLSPTQVHHLTSCLSAGPFPGSLAVSMSGPHPSPYTISFLHFLLPTGPCSCPRS